MSLHLSDATIGLLDAHPNLIVDHRVDTLGIPAIAGENSGDRGAFLLHTLPWSLQLKYSHLPGVHLFGRCHDELSTDHGRSREQADDAGAIRKSRGLERLWTSLRSGCRGGAE
jgi:hypothetical protein